MIVAVASVWAIGAVVVAIGVGRTVRIADRRDGALPARLNPRAGQHTTRAAHALFTVLLIALVLTAVGVTQQTFGGV